MPVLLGLAAVSTVATIAGGKKAKKQAASEAQTQTQALQREAADAENDLFVQAEAANQQRTLIADRLLLEDRQQAEAARQAGTPGVEFTLGSGESQAEARKRRGQFFNYTGGA